MAENKNVVILGGLGLIGFEVTYICLLKGHNVTVVDQAGTQRGTC